MGRSVWLVLTAVLFLVLVSGCAFKPSNGTQNATENTTYVYDNTSNASGNGLPDIEDITNGFTFIVHGETEFWMKENDTTKFTVVFSNTDDYMEAHKYIARVFPSATNFDVMAAYKCLHFTTCDALLSHMNSMLNQSERQVEINYTRIGLYQIGIRIPSDTSSGTYMYNLIACRDLAFAECNQTTTNFGPNIPIIVHVLG